MTFRRFILLLPLLVHVLTGTADEKDHVTVAVFSINDFHGAFVRNDAQDIPGAAAVWQTLDSLKTVYPHHLTVSAGDNFGGSYFYSATRYRSLLPQFFHDTGIRISAVGNHEFDEGQDALAARWNDVELRPRDWDLRYVCANVRDGKGHTPDYMRPYAVEEIAISPAKRLRIAFVGLIASSTPQQVSTRRIQGLTFSGDYIGVLDSLRRTPGYEAVQGADIRLLLTHIGTQMNPERNVPEWNDKDTENLLNINDPSFHAILSSHSHEAVCGRINSAQYPVVQGKWHGNYISMVRFTVDTLAMRVVKAEPEIVRVTPKKHLAPGPRRLQAQIDELLETTRTQGGWALGDSLTTARRTLIHDREDKYRQTEMGRLVCTAYAEAFRHAAALKKEDIVIGCSHFGSIRSGFVKGPVSVLSVGEALPFSNPLKTYRLTGRQLRELVETGFHNKKYGHLQTSHLKITLDGQGHVKALAYILPGTDGGKTLPIKDKTTCYLAADEFITNGGDGYSAAFFSSLEEIRTEGLPFTTDAFISYLKQLPAIE